MSKMKNKILVLIAIILMSLIIIEPASARKGVGIVWETESEIVNEESTHCITYGLYNPWDEDINIILRASEEFRNLIKRQEAESKFIKAGTFHEDAVPAKVCFEIAKVYEENCLALGLGCEKKCEGPEKIYNGKILANEVTTGDVSGSTGSTTSLGVSIPLNLRVNCSPQPRSLIVFYLVFIGIALIATCIILYKKTKKR